MLHQVDSDGLWVLIGDLIKEFPSGTVLQKPPSKMSVRRGLCRYVLAPLKSNIASLQPLHVPNCRSDAYLGVRASA